MNNSGGFITVDAVTPCIASLNNYGDQIKKFKDEHDHKVRELSDFQRDQNFAEYEKWFNDYWPEIENFRKTIEDFNKYLEDKREFINKEYSKVTVKRTNITNTLDKLNKLKR